MTGVLHQEEVRRQGQQLMEREQMPLPVEELEEAGSNRVQGTKLLRSPGRAWVY